MLKKIVDNARRFNDRAFALKDLQFRLDMTIWQNGQMVLKSILDEPRSQEPKRLLKSGYKVCSQNDEDGIIAEIFRRIGTSSKRFFEIGVGDGWENNTCALLYQGWRGTWVEAGADHNQLIREGFADRIKSGKIKHIEQFVTRDSQFDMMDIDLFSIDIDGNDYHIVEAIKNLKARVVVVEYNARFRPPIKWTMPYRDDYVWRGEAQTGCSLSLWCDLLTEKGYSLVGCSISGVNAFFVKNDLLGDHFAAPFTAENHYEPPRQWIGAWR